MQLRGNVSFGWVEDGNRIVAKQTQTFSAKLITLLHYVRGEGPRPTWRNNTCPPQWQGQGRGSLFSHSKYFLFLSTGRTSSWACPCSRTERSGPWPGTESWIVMESWLSRCFHGGGPSQAADIASHSALLLYLNLVHRVYWQQARQLSTNLLHSGVLEAGF
jgi:hypothetical protein